MNATPPKYASWAAMLAPIKQGESGWRVFALQVALCEVSGDRLALDGDFGPGTLASVKRFQKSAKLTADGIAGPATQAALLRVTGSMTHDLLGGVPDGLMAGFALGEGAGILAATNWSVPGGVDCGPMQYRVYGPPYDQARMRAAFDALESMVAAGKEFLARTNTFYKGAWVARQGSKRTELAKRIAVLAHNWPVGARDWAAQGSCTRPGERATWVAPGTKFPDGTLVVTRFQWCQFYSMGGPHGEGSITKYVKSWA